ncbi:MAG: UPF0146 family protein, partial [Candidatus Omnitrophica bacterium]|nr:UPF0146 family protein [Candidatus Omnitrophota bacterium]
SVNHEDGSPVEWHDSSMLNWRDIRMLETYADLVNRLIAFGVGGVRVDVAHRFGVMLPVDPKLQSKQKLFGYVMSWERETGGGFKIVNQWDDNEANPLLAYLVSRVTAEHPDFIFIGESYSNHNQLIKSGIIPTNAATHDELENVIIRGKSTQDVLNQHALWLFNALVKGGQVATALETHDYWRLTDISNSFGPERLVSAVMIWLALSRGLTVVYNRQEIGELYRSRIDNYTGQDYTGADKARAWAQKEFLRLHGETVHDFYTRLIRFFKQHKALHSGLNYIFPLNNHRVFAIARFNHEENFIFVVNCGWQEAEVYFNAPDLWNTMNILNSADALYSLSDYRGVPQQIMSGAELYKNGLRADLKTFQSRVLTIQSLAVGKQFDGGGSSTVTDKTVIEGFMRNGSVVFERCEGCDQKAVAGVMTEAMNNLKKYKVTGYADTMLADNIFYFVFNHDSSGVFRQKNNGNGDRAILPLSALNFGEKAAIDIITFILRRFLNRKRWPRNDPEEGDFNFFVFQDKESRQNIISGGKHLAYPRTDVLVRLHEAVTTCVEIHDDYARSEAIKTLFKILFAGTPKDKRFEEEWLFMLASRMFITVYYSFKNENVLGVSPERLLGLIIRLAYVSLYYYVDLKKGSRKYLIEQVLTGLASVAEWEHRISQAEMSVFIIKLDELVCEGIRKMRSREIGYHLPVEIAWETLRLFTTGLSESRVRGILGEVSGVHKFTFVFGDTLFSLRDPSGIGEFHKIYTSTRALKEVDAESLSKKTMLEFKFSARIYHLYEQIVGYGKTASVFSIIIEDQKEAPLVENIVYAVENNAEGLMEKLKAYAAVNRDSRNKEQKPLSERLFHNEDGFFIRFSLNEFKDFLKSDPPLNVYQQSLELYETKSIIRRNEKRKMRMPIPEYSREDRRAKKAEIRRYLDDEFSGLRSVLGEKRYNSFDVYLSISNPKGSGVSVLLPARKNPGADGGVYYSSIDPLRKALCDYIAGKIKERGAQAVVEIGVGRNINIAAALKELFPEVRIIVVDNKDDVIADVEAKNKHEHLGLETKLDEISGMHVSRFILESDIIYSFRPPYELIEAMMKSGIAFYMYTLGEECFSRSRFLKIPFRGYMYYEYVPGMGRTEGFSGEAGRQSDGGTAGLPEVIEKAEEIIRERTREINSVIAEEINRGIKDSESEIILSGEISRMYLDMLREVCAVNRSTKELEALSRRLSDSSCSTGEIMDAVRDIFRQENHSMLFAHMSVNYGNVTVTNMPVFAVYKLINTFPLYLKYRNRIGKGMVLYTEQTIIPDFLEARVGHDQHIATTLRHVKVENSVPIVVKMPVLLEVLSAMHDVRSCIEDNDRIPSYAATGVDFVDESIISLVLNQWPVNSPTEDDFISRNYTGYLDRTLKHEGAHLLNNQYMEILPYALEMAQTPYIWMRLLNILKYKFSSGVQDAHHILSSDFYINTFIPDILRRCGEDIKGISPVLIREALQGDMESLLGIIPRIPGKIYQREAQDLFDGLMTDDSPSDDGSDGGDLFKDDQTAVTVSTLIRVSDYLRKYGKTGALLYLDIDDTIVTQICEY